MDWAPFSCSLLAPITRYPTRSQTDQVALAGSAGNDLIDPVHRFKKLSMIQFNVVGSIDMSAVMSPPTRHIISNAALVPPLCFDYG